MKRIIINVNGVDRPLITDPAKKLADVHAPIGLEIGADNPEEIAISIVAELIACRRRCAAALSRRGLRPETEEIRPKKSA